MKSAELDTKIIIEENQPTQNGLGEPVDAWTEVVTVFAKRIPRPGREFFQAGKTYSESYVYFILRHVDGITPQMRVTWGTEVYLIVDVQYSEKRRESIQLTCTTVA